MGHGPTETSLVSRSLNSCPKRSRAAGNQPGYRQKPFSLPLYWQYPRTLFSFCNSIDLSKVESVDRLTNGCALECGVGFANCGRAVAHVPGQLCATTGHAVRSIGSDIIRPLAQREYQDRLHRSRPHVRELEAAPDCEPSPAERTETAPSPRGMRESHPQHHD